MDEEDAFWSLTAITTDLVPEYYGPSMEGLQAHAKLLENVAGQLVPKVLTRFLDAGVPMGLIAVCDIFQIQFSSY